MKIGIFGLGAMGSVYATFFAEAGHEVIGFDEWEDHINAINSSGLRLSGVSGDRINHNIKVVKELNQKLTFDFIIVSTKASGVKKATKKILPFLNSKTLVITIQNGMGSSNEVLKTINNNNVLIGVADGFGASIVKPGHAHHNLMKLIRIGEINGGISERLKSIVNIWKKSGFNIISYKNIDQLVWEKFICNVTFSGPCTVYNCSLGELIDKPEFWEVAKGCALEVYEIAKKKNVSLSFNNPIEYVKEFGSKMPDAKPSMLLDHLSRRKSEIDFLNGKVVNLGLETKTHTPFNFMLTSIIKKKEEDFK